MDAWTAIAGITGGTVFRATSKAGRVWGDGMTPNLLWDVVRHAARPLNASITKRIAVA